MVWMYIITLQQLTIFNLLSLSYLNGGKVHLRQVHLFCYNSRSQHYPCSKAVSRSVEQLCNYSIPPRSIWSGMHISPLCMWSTDESMCLPVVTLVWPRVDNIWLLVWQLYQSLLHVQLHAQLHPSKSSSSAINGIGFCFPLDYVTLGFSCSQCCKASHLHHFSQMATPCHIQP